MKTFMIGLAMLGLGVTVPGAAMAQSAPAGAAEKFKAVDTNGDGTLSREEWKAAGRRDRGFNYVDADKDGKITPAELQAEKFKAVDTNGDGTLSREEWKAAGRRDRGFNYVDADKDGKITPAELQTAAAKRGM
ncbi:EF hand [Sphingomonas laterariae]|uniref:EF hand n=1 Tax=Edaphosphingomonas laterariae TaxID=861865 RepID=A0A239K8B0_9SPHN|nr:EF-hand domain-containing protein [Sphingomonas laterariae]SNT13873.1 EF hand [Sphingomonas laterariae]